MRSNVTAILVAKHSGEVFSETVEALFEQTVQPARVMIVAAGNERLAEELAAQAANYGTVDRIIGAGANSSFGHAVGLAVHASDTADQGTGPEWLWLLAEDTAPERDALEHMLTTVEATGTAAVAGPKLVDWFDPRLILELGQGLTRTGARWVIDRQELDQQQYDHTEDVLGVGPIGMLVRRDVWQRLGGFDAALPVVDDGLDFSVRARLAGYRVIVVPEARIRTQRLGIAGPAVRRSRTVMRRSYRQARTAQLHRSLTYAPAPLAPFMWLGLPIVGVLLMLWSLIRERPGTMLGELWAALAVFFRPARVLRSRRNLRRNNTVGWRAIRPLRTDRATVKTVRMVRREAILTALGRQRKDLNFIGSGGLAVIIVATFISVALSWWAFGASFLSGGGFAPLSDTVAALWSNTVTNTPADPLALRAWGEVSPVDPFSWVLAVIGSVTFWNPSASLVLLTIVAVPLAAFGGWIWATRLSEATSARVLVGVVWAVSPVLLAALSQGRPAAIVLATTLPWLLHSLSLAMRSWSWAGVASLLAAVALAAAPVLWPAALVLLIAGMLTHPRASGRLLTILIAPVAVFAPGLITAFANGRPVTVLADPGLPLNATPATQWQMILGFPTFGLDGWGTILERFQIETTLPVTLTVGFLLVPLALLALLGMYTGHPKFTALAALAGALGLITALLSPKLLIVPAADRLVGVWPGAGLTLYWMAVLSLAALGVHMLFKAAPAVTALAIAGALIIVAPGIVGVATGKSKIAPNRPLVPAVVAAESRIDPATNTLFITPLGTHELRARLLVGTGPKLDALRTADAISLDTNEGEVIADLVAALASTGDAELRELLAASHVKFVVLERGANRASSLRQSLQTGFDQHSAITSIGDTRHGQLWSVVSDDPSPFVTSEESPNHALWIIQLIVLGALIMLALPTGEARERPQRLPRSGRRVARESATVAASGAFGVGDTGEHEPDEAEDAPDAKDGTQPDETGESADNGDDAITETSGDVSRVSDDATDDIEDADEDLGDDSFFTRGDHLSDADIWEEPDDDTIIADQGARP